MREKNSQKRKLKKLIQLPVQYLGKDEIQLVRGAPLGIQEGAWKFGSGKVEHFCRHRIGKVGFQTLSHFL